MTIGDHVAIASALEMYDRFRSYVTVEQDVCAFFDKDFLSKRKWQAAVVSEELSPADAAALASACRGSGYRTAWALDINQFDSELFYSIALDHDRLSMLEEIFVTPSYLLIEKDERFMLLSDGDYYWEVAGSPVFLKTLFGRPAEAVNQDFVTETVRYRRGSSRIGRALSRIASEATGASLSTT